MVSRGEWRLEGDIGGGGSAAGSLLLLLQLLGSSLDRHAETELR